MQPTRSELESAIEREVHRLVERISAHTYDFVNTYVRRNNIPVEYAQMEEILKLVKIAIQDGEMKQIDFFHEGIRKAVDETVGSEEKPFTTGLSKQEPKAQEKEETYTFSL